MALSRGSEIHLLLNDSDADSSERDHIANLELEDFEDDGPKPTWRTRWRLSYHSILQVLGVSLAGVACLVIVAGLFFPSYSNPPRRYKELRNLAREPSGRVNVRNEKIFIAASLYDAGGELVSGDWGKSLLGLIDILGPDNVFLSLYEDNADDGSKIALRAFEKRLSCQSSVVVEDLDVSGLRHVTTLDGQRRLSRIGFLAEVRNRALRPLDDEHSPASAIRFERLLYLNDVIFDPVDAANLLFSTNADEKTGRPRYLAACATDFINSFKFYDTFATRDFEGFDMGVPFYPWFTGAGDGASRKDVLAQTDAVRVKSCWGGMVAFEAQWFQTRTEDALRSGMTNQPVRFRADNETFWESSECCLVHADIAASADAELAAGESGIFMNPYIRVAYSKAVLDRLHFTRRFERLYTPVQAFINWIASRPSFNARQLEQPGDEVVDRVWSWDTATRTGKRVARPVEAPERVHGRYESLTRIARPGSFCGTRHMSFINADNSKGGKRWGTVQAPADKAS
ncbi:hypothetical protein B0A48_18477 [Cryoendolithus antarcticus]|uniref:Glycosyltransferase family 69 protein n=1 Tax=Cryoendolithus antarcticus TaxID=1507870 RepID=A0A1V8S952_9PEZI|nr:hypothetical protein B0A48_18477 [Cryoendolithus antarcticus]